MSFLERRDIHYKCVQINGQMFKGRKCAEQMNKVYKRMQADMYNLYPFNRRGKWKTD